MKLTAMMAMANAQLCISNKCDSNCGKCVKHDRDDDKSIKDMGGRYNSN